MKRLFPALFSLLGVSIFFSCRGKNNYTTSPDGKSLLWEISGNGLTVPSYFFGTMHLMCAEDTKLSGTTLNLVKRVDQIYLEVDLDNASELLSGMLEMRRDSGLNLRAVLNEAEYQKIKSFFEIHQPSMPFNLLELQPPLMIASGLYELLLPCEQKNGVDIKIIEEAYKQKKQTKGLETIAFQASIFDSIPYEEQAKDLVRSIDSLEKNRVAMNEMIRLYKSQDIEGLYTLSTNEDSGISSHLDLLLYKRNQEWVSQFKRIAKDSSTLFAVGAGHLGGDKGVLQLLRNGGFTVRPLAN